MKTRSYDTVDVFYLWAKLLRRQKKLGRPLTAQEREQLLNHLDADIDKADAKRGNKP